MYSDYVSNALNLSIKPKNIEYLRYNHHIMLMGIIQYLVMRLITMIILMRNW